MSVPCYATALQAANNGCLPFTTPLELDVVKGRQPVFAGQVVLTLLSWMSISCPHRQLASARILRKALTLPAASAAYTWTLNCTSAVCKM